MYAMNKESLRGMEASTGYNHPYLKAFFKKPMPVIGHEPKLEVEQDFADWVRFIGYPGPMTKIATSMYAKYVIPTMFARVARDESSPEEAVRAAQAEIERINPPYPSNLANPKLLYCMSTVSESKPWWAITSAENELGMDSHPFTTASPFAQIFFSAFSLTSLSC